MGSLNFILYNAKFDVNNFISERINQHIDLIKLNAGFAQQIFCFCLQVKL